ncbi:ATPase [bacterium]|nr:ATPase [bacterium]
MHKLIAVPVDNQGILDAHFGHCKMFKLIKVEEGKVLSEEGVVPPPHEPGLLPKWLAEKGVTDILAGGMGQQAIQLFTQNNINAFVGAPKWTAQDIVQAHIEGKLELTGNACDH